ncbi:glycosyltransferase family 4 protein [Bacteroidota bacterium]
MKKEKDNPKVLYVGRYNSDEILTGPEKVAKRIFHLKAKFDKTTFVEYFFDGKQYSYFIKLFGKTNVGVINYSPILRLGIIRLLFFVFNYKPDIIHIITFERFAALLFIFKLFKKIRYIYNVHGVIIHENVHFRDVKWFQKIKDYVAEKIFLRFSNDVFVLSDTCKELIKKYYKLENNKFNNIDNGIDLEFHEASSMRKYKTNNSLKLVFIADIVRKEKGFYFFKSTLEEINFPIDLYIVDKKDTIDNFEFINKKINVYSYDKMCPSELAEFFKDKDVFVSSSFYEPYSISAVEAMASGLVPIFTYETGASKHIIDEINGYILDFGDKEKLKSILMSLIENHESIKKISSEARKIYNQFSWIKVYGDYEKIYKQELKNNTSI